jgi:ABC-type dipeptide/oligopeptide/nickel transport system permease component
MARLLTTDYARTLLAIGASKRQQRWLLMPNVVSEVLTSLQKLAVAMLGILLFVEPIFGAAGIGTTALRAIRRSDVDLLLGVVVVFSLATVAIGLIGQAVQARMHRTVR